MVLQHASRWSSLSVDLAHHDNIFSTEFSFLLDHLGEMSRLRFLSLDCLGRGGKPWLTVLENIVTALPEEGVRRLQLEGLELGSQMEHDDLLVEDLGVGVQIFSNLTFFRAHVAPRVAMRILHLCTSLTDAEFEFTIPRTEFVKAWSVDPVVLPRLVGLCLKAYPYPSAHERLSFPHDVFSAILDHVICPSLSSLTVGLEQCSVIRPMGLDSALDERTYMEVLARQRIFQWEWGSSDDSPEQEDTHVDRDGNPLAMMPFFPTSLDRFLSHSPSLKELDLRFIPLHYSHLIQILKTSSKLEDLRISEADICDELEKGLDVPEPLADTGFMDWLTHEENLPNLLHLGLRLAIYTPKCGSLETLLETLQRQGLTSATIESRSKWSGSEEAFDFERLKSLQKKGLRLAVWYLDSILLRHDGVQMAGGCLKYEKDGRARVQ
ncbi:hypothetical protein PM082_018418 [Marasmius tenuissimus]|nr:hypothetical protein PM082_018418 [Marasmius tenuissimus]